MAGIILCIVWTWETGKPTQIIMYTTNLLVQLLGVDVNSNHAVYDYNFIGSYHSGIGAPGNVPVPYDGNKAWTVQLSSQYLCKVKNLSVHLIPTFRSLFGHVLPLDTYHPLKR